MDFIFVEQGENSELHCLVNTSPNDVLMSLENRTILPDDDLYQSALAFYENQPPATELSPEEKIVELRREFRTAVFAQTIDKLNPIWFATLGSEERVELERWRQAWLDYPAASSSTDPPDLPAVFGGQNG